MRHVSVVYIDIQSLLDLRQGFLLSRGQQSIKDITDYVNSDEYNYRKTDNLRWTEEDEYRKAIETKDITIVTNSTITGLIETLSSRVAAISMKNEMDGSAHTPSIWFNVYPFEFDQDTLKAFRDILFSRMKQDTFVEVVSIPPLMLTPSYMLSQNFSEVIMYDYSVWLDLHGENIMSGAANKISFICPPISRREVTPTMEAELPELKEIDFYSMMEFTLSPYLQMKFMSMFYYSNFITASRHAEEAGLAIQSDIDRLVREQEAAEAEAEAKEASTNKSEE